MTFLTDKKRKEKKMNKDDYIMHLEILVEDLIAEIEDLSDSYGFSIDGGDCNYRYMKKEYKLLKEKEIKWNITTK